MKFIFIVQGEGRGHMTQAISLLEILEGQGHIVTDVFIGTSKRRKIPEFVYKQMGPKLRKISSPNFVTDKNQKSVNLSKTLIYNFFKIKEFCSSLLQIHKTVRENEPDVILNFYDILAGIYNGVFRPECFFLTIGHQYLSSHGDFPFAPGSPLQKLLFKWNTAITAWAADKKLALSFKEYPSHTMKNLEVIPPVLRSEIFGIRPGTGNYFLAYMVNPGFGEEIIRFAKNQPNFNIEVFWDMKEMPEIYKATKNLTFYQINDRLFLEKMASCKGLLSTAGFESLCEAFYFDKKVMMVPLPGQYEQSCNSLDAEKAGIGWASEHFDFLAFQRYLELPRSSNKSYLEWLNTLEPKIHQIISELHGNEIDDKQFFKPVLNKI